MHTTSINAVDSPKLIKCSLRIAFVLNEFLIGEIGGRCYSGLPDADADDTDVDAVALSDGVSISFVNRCRNRRMLASGNV